MEKDAVPDIASQHEANKRGSFSITSEPMRHAFICVGTHTLYLCHQIMSHMEGHNFELVLEVELPIEIKQKLLKDRTDRGATHYFANIEKFTLEWLALNSSSSMNDNDEPLTFHVDIWNEFPRHPKLMPPWLDESIEKFASNVPITVVRIVAQSHVNENTLGRIREEYHLFGEGKEAHIYHSVVRRPDYDHIATLTSAPDWLSEEQLRNGVRISVVELGWSYDHTYCSCPLIDGRSYNALYFGIQEYRNHEGKNPTSIGPFLFTVNKTWWYSTRVVNYIGKNPCPIPPNNEIS